jgi:hypothetical protein
MRSSWSICHSIRQSSECLLKNDTALIVLCARTQDRANHQRIWLFTNDDNPNANFADERERTIQQAKVGSVLVLFPF